jgi:hypothetical protein
MKPLNLDNNSCSPISSNCVIWQGPNIPCIKLCTGDSITDVIYALATELCTIVDAVNISTLDLSCLEITTGDPTNLNELLQLLVNKICELNNISTSTTNVTRRDNTTCPTDCVVPVAECLQSGGQTTMKLLDYIQVISNKICSILTDIVTINNSITNLTTRVFILESVPPTPPYILPSFAPDCTLADSSVEQNISYQLDVILEALVNDDVHGYCALLSSTGQPSEITQAYLSQPIVGSEVALSNCSQTLEQKFATDWFPTPDNLSQSFTDLWLTVKDLRDAYKTYKVVAGNTNVTVTPTTNVSACGPELQFAVSAKGSSVVAGTNVTVTSNEVAGNTAYTVNATSKNTTVVAGDNITVAENTSNPNNTIYTVTGKEAIVTKSTNTNNITNVTSTAGPGAGDTTYTVETLYGLDTFVAIVAINSTSQPECGNLPIQTPGPGVMVGSAMRIINKYNFVSLNNVATNNTTSAGAYVTTVTTLPFGTFDNVDGEVLITKPGTYQITGTLQLKSANATPPIWQTSGIGSFHLGILSNSNDVFTGNSQSLQGPMTLAAGSTPLTIPGVHTTVSLSATATISVSSSTVVRLGIFNFSDRNYNGTVYQSGDSIRFAITRLR